MDTAVVAGLGSDLGEFAADVFASLQRYGRAERACQYVQGLLLDGKRKSVQPMAGRLPGVSDQALNHFVTDSPWDVEPVAAAVAARMDAVIAPVAWAVDDTGFLKCGKHSACVARQYTGTAGKVTNCQVGVSLDLVTDTASVPINWRLFVPEAWDPASEAARGDVDAARRKAGVPDDVGHVAKWRLGLEIIDAARAWGLVPPMVVADAGYGDSAPFRMGLTERGVDYVVQIESSVSVYPATAQRRRIDGQVPGVGRPSLARYRCRPESVKDYITRSGLRPRKITWRDRVNTTGRARAALSSHFVFARVRPAGRAVRRAYKGSDIPVETLIAEWPPGKEEPVKYWLSTLAADTGKKRLVRYAKMRWRIEGDYRELKGALGLAHSEGRSWTGWHHHTTLVSAAHAFLTLQRLHPNTRRRDDPLPGNPTPPNPPDTPDRTMPDLPNPLPDRKTSPTGHQPPPNLNNHDHTEAPRQRSAATTRSADCRTHAAQGSHPAGR